jgi:beta-glucosidase/6-phospho-beta-glucosidase/beta-galactosidase
MIGFSVQCIKPKSGKKRDFWRTIPTYVAAYLSNHFAFSQLKNKYLDFLGAQFYSRLNIEFDFKLIPPLKLTPNLMSPNMVFDQHPEDILYILKILKKYKLPIIITENGYLGDDDERRCKYLKKIFEHLDPFIKDNKYLVGYYYWS